MNTPPDGSRFVQCPACIATVPAHDINSHLDGGCKTTGGGAAGGAGPVAEAEPPVMTPKAHPEGIPVFAPVFQPPSKTVYLIRHGESEANLAWHRFASAARNGGVDRSHDVSLWEQYTEPDDVFDARLTAKGMEQASHVGPQLEKLGVPATARWVCSPLSRAIKTCLLSGPPDPTAVLILPVLTEHLNSKGDVGRPKSSVVRDFQEVEAGFEDVPEVWWPQVGDRPSDGDKKILGSLETIEHVRKRAGEFRRWLLQQNEDTFVVVGHSTFFMQFMGSKSRLRNCEVHAMRI